MIWLPPHKCGLYLEHNPNRDSYESVEAYVAQLDPTWKDEASKQRAITENELWILQWYPETPVGCYQIAAPTLEELIEFAKEIK